LVCFLVYNYYDGRLRLSLLKGIKESELGAEIKRAINAAIIFRFYFSVGVCAVIVVVVGMEGGDWRRFRNLYYLIHEYDFHVRLNPEKNADDDVGTGRPIAAEHVVHVHQGTTGTYAGVDTAEPCACFRKSTNPPPGSCAEPRVLRDDCFVTVGRFT